MATHRSPYPSTPPISLTSYGTYHRSELKKRVEKAREAFSSDKESQENCKNYLENNNNYEYSDRWQKGLVPKPLVQSGQYNKSDTFFTDFEKHYPESYILSRSESSYIIGNKASYDTRQYTAEWDPCVYNVVELEDTKIIVEMFEHFGNFWKDPTAIGKVNDRIELAIQLRAKEVIEHLEKDPDTFPERKKAWDVVMEDVERYRKGCAEKLRQLTVGKDGIVFRFQAGTDASIPHLHMHVLASPAEFRKYSTPDHDYKAIPTKMVMEVIKSENEPILRRDIEGDVTTFSHSHNTTAQTQHPHLLNPADQVVLDPHAFVAQWNRDHRDTNNVFYICAFSEALRSSLEGLQYPLPEPVVENTVQVNSPDSGEEEAYSPLPSEPVAMDPTPTPVLVRPFIPLRYDQHAGLDDDFGYDWGN